MKNKNYLRQKINYNNSTEVMEGVTFDSRNVWLQNRFSFPFSKQIQSTFNCKPCKPD